MHVASDCQIGQFILPQRTWLPAQSLELGRSETPGRALAPPVTASKLREAHHENSTQATLTPRVEAVEAISQSLPSSG